MTLELDHIAPDIAYAPSIGVRRAHETPLVVASDLSLAGLGALVADPAACEIEIVRWPAQGWRPVDDGSGDQGGTTEGLFEFAWRGDDPLRPQQRGGRRLPVRLEHLARGCAGRRAGAAARAGADLARQLPSRRRPDDLADARRELRRPARPARRRRDARAVHQPSGATGCTASTCGRASGTARSSRTPTPRPSSTARAASTPASRWTSRRSSAATSRRRSGARKALDPAAAKRSTDQSPHVRPQPPPS